MTVGQLINELQKCNKEDVVYISNNNYEFHILGVESYYPIMQTDIKIEELKW